MDTNCRKCDASVNEEEAFCPRCGGVMGAETDAQPGGEDDSWNIPATLIGQKRPALPSRSEQTDAESHIARATPDTPNELQIPTEE